MPLIARIERGPLVAFSQRHTFFPKGVAGLSFTARIERAHSYRARSASKKDGLAAPFRSFLGRAFREHEGQPGRSRLHLCYETCMSALKLVLWGFLAILGAVALAFVVGFVNPKRNSEWALAHRRGGGLYLCAG